MRCQNGHGPACKAEEARSTRARNSNERAPVGACHRARRRRDPLAGYCATSLAQRQRQCVQTASSRSSNLRSRTNLAHQDGRRPFDGRLGQRQSPTAQNGLQSGFESPVGYHFTRLAQRKSVGPTNRRARFRNSQRVPSCVFSSAAERALDMREAAGSSPARRTTSMLLYLSGRERGR